MKNLAIEMAMKQFNASPGVMIPITDHFSSKETRETACVIVNKAIKIYSKSIDKIERQNNMMAFAIASSRYKDLYRRLLESSTEQTIKRRRKSEKPKKPKKPEKPQSFLT